LIVPLTTSQKKHKMRIPVGKIDGKHASVMISQVRVVDTRRLEPHVATVDKKIFERIRNAVRALL
jgi:mRNA-degrading endonuclease toxin of MazEF toxin-antitoxin module